MEEKNKTLRERMRVIEGGLKERRTKKGEPDEPPPPEIDESFVELLLDVLDDILSDPKAMERILYRPKDKEKTLYRMSELKKILYEGFNGKEAIVPVAALYFNIVIKLRSYLNNEKRRIEDLLAVLDTWGEYAYQCEDWNLKEEDELEPA